MKNKSCITTINGDPVLIVDNWSSGEMKVKFADSWLESKEIPVARIKNSENMLEVILFLYMVKIPRIYIPYLPYAREDHYKPNTIRLLTSMMELMNNNKTQVVTLEPHSDVILFQKTPIGIMYVDKSIENFIKIMGLKEAIKIAPDLGATKRYPFDAFFMKTRNENGAPDMKLYDWNNDWQSGNRPIFIRDDIVDGGRTFIEAAKILKEKNPDAKLFLWATHGIFSHGIEELLFFFDAIGTTNSYSLEMPRHERLFVYDVFTDERI